MNHAPAERHARPSNPLASRSRAVLAFHARWRHFPDGDADRARLLDNENSPGMLLESRFPAFTSYKEPVLVDARNAREAYTRAWIENDKKIDARDPTVSTFDESIKCKSVKHGSKKKLPKFPGGRSFYGGVYEACKHSLDTTEIRHTYNNIARIPACMSNYKNLKELALNGTKVSRIENLDKNTNLEVLWLSGTEVSKIENLDNLVNLKELWLGDTPVSKIEGLDALVNLKQLGLSSTHVSKIEGLDTLVELEHLHLNDMSVSKIENIDKLVNLKRLELQSTQVNRIEGLDNLVNLEELNLFHTPVNKIEGLEKNTKLKKLDISYTRVPDAEIHAFKKQRPRVNVVNES